MAPWSLSRAQAIPLYCTAATTSLLVPLATIESNNGASPKSASGLGIDGQLAVPGTPQAMNHASKSPSCLNHLISPLSMSKARIELKWASGSMQGSGKSLLVLLFCCSSHLITWGGGGVEITGADVDEIAGHVDRGAAAPNSSSRVSSSLKIVVGEHEGLPEDGAC